ncbi:MAG: hypothetical protein ACI8X5_000900 [Planctomycetota bacterium]|jgi:hypothetical protein
MTDSQKNQPDEFDELEALPLDAEIMELPDDVELVELAELPDDIEELPGDVEATPAPKSAAMPAPKPMPAAKPMPAVKPVAKVAPKPAAKAVAKPAPKPAAIPVKEPKPVVAAAAIETPAKSESASAPAPVAAPVKSADGGGSRRERQERNKESHTPKKKGDHWARWTHSSPKPKREMEKAPSILRKAALGLVVGCLLPWGGVTPDWIGNVAEKLMVLGGLYVWHQAHLLRDGIKVPGFIEKLGAKSFKPLMILAAVLILVGFAPILSFGSLAGEDMKQNFGPFAEKGFLILAGLTMTHIYDYEVGGKFNPLFPIVFLAPGLAGVIALVKVFSADPIGAGQILGGVGAVLVGIAGWMAAYTMYVAMKEAVAHGDAKKKLQAEARKEARATARSSSGKK